MGYGDEELLCPSSLSETLRCSLCRLLFEDPVFCWGGACQHTFCRSCIEAELLRRRRCPTCREPSERRDLQSNRFVNDLVNQVPVRCCIEGCTWQGQLGSRHEHEVACHDAHSRSTVSAEPSLPSPKSKSRVQEVKDDLFQLNKALRTEVSELAEVFESLLNERELLKKQLGMLPPEAFQCRRHLLSLLQRDVVRLLRASFVADYNFEKSGPLPRRQDLPQDAFFDFSSMTEEDFDKVDIVVLSYCRVSKTHPDPTGHHTNTVAAMCRMYLEGNRAEVDYFAPCFKHAGEAISRFGLETNIGIDCFGANGRPEQVAIFWDWACLHQELPEAKRTPAERAIFKEALASVHVLYGAVFTTKWILMTLPPEASQRKRDCRESGWMRFEKQVASIRLPVGKLVEVTPALRDRLLAKTADAYDYMRFVLESMEVAERFQLLSPAQFDKVVDGLKFSNPSDKDMVIRPRYKEAFEALFSQATNLQFKGMRLANAPHSHASDLLKLTQQSCRSLLNLDFSGNADLVISLEEFGLLSAAGIQLQSLSLQHCPRVTGDLTSLSTLKTLKALHLQQSQVGGDIAGLATLIMLTVLDLRSTKVIGDVAGLASLHALSYLSLQSTMVSGELSGLSALSGLKHLDLQLTQVSGSIAALTSLRSLRSLELWSTQTSGDIAALAPLVGLWKLHLQETEASGDVASLAPLAGLVHLDLRATKVGGDLAGLSPLTRLTSLDLQLTQVNGDVANLVAMPALEHLDLSQTQVRGDVSGLSPLTGLKSLDLWSTQVTGSLSSLCSMTALGFLDLQDTQVVMACDDGEAGLHLPSSGISHVCLPHLSNGDMGDLRKLLPHSAIWLQ